MDRENREIEREELRRGWRRTGWYPDLTVAEALAAGAAARPDDLLVFASSDGGSDTVTLAALHARAGELASRLAATGIAPGDVVVLQAPSDRQGTEAVVALWLLGAVLVPLATTATPDELAHVVRETGAAVVLVVPAWRGVDLATRAAGTAERVVVLGRGSRGPAGP
ncbi:MAG: AMP-binding protein [Acidimicrobiia bacterium]|nr:AMP-binding protein [Acidimicrobiia bacterium]